MEAGMKFITHDFIERVEEFFIQVHFWQLFILSVQETIETFEGLEVSKKALWEQQEDGGSEETAEQLDACSVEFNTRDKRFKQILDGYFRKERQNDLQKLGTMFVELQLEACEIELEWKDRLGGPTALIPDFALNDS
eukprot:gene16756-5149_t